MKIRKYNSSDRKLVEDINFETGFLGESLSKIMDNRSLRKNAIKYYVEKEPESVFVAVENDQVVGYVFGSLKKHNQSLNYLKSLFTNLLVSPFMSKKNRKYWLNEIKYLILVLLKKSQELNVKEPRISSYVHINVLKKYRNKNVGSKLLEKFVSFAKRKDAKIVCAQTWEKQNRSNRTFWLKNGFKEFSKGKTLHWKPYLPNENIYYTIYVRKL